jgi:transposase InsO family protein
MVSQRWLREFPSPLMAARYFTGLCERLGARQSMGRVGSCFDNAAAEAYFSTLEHEVLSRHHFTTRA